MPSVKHGTLSGSTPKPFGHKGKGGGKTLLPSRRALHQLTKGAPSDTTLLDYGELTPSGRNAPSTYPDLTASINKKSR